MLDLLHTLAKGGASPHEDEVCFLILDMSYDACTESSPRLCTVEQCK